MRFFPLLLLSCLTCVGQPGPIALRSIDRCPPANPTPCIASFTDPAQLNGLAWRWVASDATNGQYVIDRIQTNIWIQNTGGNQPAKSGNHLNFNGTTSWMNITNVTLTFETNCSYYLIISTSNNVTDEVFMGSQNNLVCLCYIRVYDGGTDSTLWRSAQEAFGTYSSNTVHDFIYSASLGSRDREFINGTVVHTNSQISPTATFSPFYVGKWVINGIGDVNFWKGSFYEMGVYTNKLLTQDEICSLHYYATNTYGFTP